MMTSSQKIAQYDIETLTVVRYPDPRLAEVCTAVDSFDEPLRRLADKMFELMFQFKGVGLAANQAGVTIQLFVASPAYSQDDRRVYVNPKIIALEGNAENEEGCLSLPGINVKIKRRAIATIEAQDLDGKSFQETGEGLTARIFQHETDHLNGLLLVNKMGSVARLAYRRTIRELEEKFAETQTSGTHH